MTRRPRLDANHAEIVHALERCGCTVQSLAAVGSGCPDLLVGMYGNNYLLEIKDGNKPPSARKLTTDETAWHTKWKGDVRVVESKEHALLAIGFRL